MPNKKQPDKSAKKVPDKNFELVPYGKSNCRICILPHKHLKEIHRLWFDEKIGYRKMREYLKENHKIGNDYTYLNKHFNNHAKSDKTKLIKTESKNKSVVEIILATEGAEISSTADDRKIQTAYSKLVDMAAGFTDMVDKFQKEISKQHLTDKQIKKMVKDGQPLSMLNLIVDMNRAARAQIKDVNALRSPKVLILELIEDMADEYITAVNSILAALFIMVQEEITDELKKKDKTDLINDAVFTLVFKKIAQKYKDRMLAVRKEQIAKASNTLAELEKII
jgi:hypothetical protein